MKKLNTGFWAAALMCVFVLSGAVVTYAASDRGYDQPLSPEQFAQARKIFDDNYAGMSATRQALAVKRAELDALLFSPAPDRARIESLSREIGELRGKMLANRVEVRAQLEKQGLPADMYAPNVPPRGSWHNGPEVWHHGHGHGRPCGGRGCWW